MRPNQQARRNPLQTPGDVSLTIEPITDLTDIPLLYDYSQVDEQHRNALIADAKDYKRRDKRIDNDLLANAELIVKWRQLLPHGQFGDWVRTELNINPRKAQMMMNTWETYRGKSEIISLLGKTNAGLLAQPSVPEAARQQAEAEAKQQRVQGGKLTQQRTKQIIEQHRPPPAQPPRTLTLNETIAVVWRTIKHNLPHTQEAATRLAWLMDATPAHFLALLNTGVTLDEPLLTAARKRVEAELQDQLHHAQQKEQRRTAQQQKPDNKPGQTTFSHNSHSTIAEAIRTLLAARPPGARGRVMLTVNEDGSGKIAYGQHKAIEFDSPQDLARQLHEKLRGTGSE